jgi:peptidoglycan/xylan/chitin deacetylase (PgdA/CDA1 family)
MRTAVVRVAGRSAAVAALASALDRTSPSRPDVLAVLTYHRVGTPEESPWLHPGLISATPENFAIQMEFLASHYRVVSLDEVLEARRGRRRLAPRSVLITFDDAYTDFAGHAWPVLQALSLPVTVFVPTAFPGDPDRRFWWDRLHHAFATTERRTAMDTSSGPLPMATEPDRSRSWAVLRQSLKTIPHERLEPEVERLEALLDPPPAPPGSVLGWEQLKHLGAEGVTLGAHSRTHPLLDRLPRQCLAEEVVGSIHDLRRMTGRAPSAFAYPGGAFDDQVVAAVEESGLALAFTTARPPRQPASARVNDLRHGKWLRLRRINVVRSVTPSLLRLRLLPVLARLDRPDDRAEMTVARG